MEENQIEFSFDPDSRITTLPGMSIAVPIVISFVSFLLALGSGSFVIAAAVALLAFILSMVYRSRRKTVIAVNRDMFICYKCDSINVPFPGQSKQISRKKIYGKAPVAQLQHVWVDSFQVNYAGIPFESIWLQVRFCNDKKEGVAEYESYKATPLGEVPYGILVDLNCMSLGKPAGRKIVEFICDNVASAENDVPDEVSRIIDRRRFIVSENL
jgi:hypothetical protein